MRKMLAISIGIVLVLSFGLASCKKKEEQPVPQAPQMMPPGGQMPPGHGPSAIQVPKGELKVVVPGDVKGKWSAVKIVVEDKAAKSQREFTVKLNSEFTIPNSNLKVMVGDFIPDFRMNGNIITSGSNTPNNPAVGVKVFEGDKEIFPAPGKKWGWLYSRFPTMHPFEHPKYGLFLKEGIKKG
jgi:hypothetical protein